VQRKQDTQSKAAKQQSSEAAKQQSSEADTKMTTEVNYELMTEVLFANDTAFRDINIEEAKVIAYLCKAANSNLNVKLSFDRTKARHYFDKIFDIMFNFITYKNKIAYLKREELLETDSKDYGITSQLDEIIEGLKKENINVLEGFRELIVLEYKEFIYNYENCRDAFDDIRYNLDYCIQYNLVVNYFGYYEYYETHTYNPMHFMITPDSLYDFVGGVSSVSV
jgi:hypothetical protein